MITTNAIAAAAALEKNETKNNDDVKKKKVFEKPPPPRVRLVYLWFDTDLRDRDSELQLNISDCPTRNLPILLFF